MWHLSKAVHKAQCPRANAVDNVDKSEVHEKGTGHGYSIYSIEYEKYEEFEAGDILLLFAWRLRSNGFDWNWQRGELHALQ